MGPDEPRRSARDLTPAHPERLAARAHATGLLQGRKASIELNAARQGIDPWQPRTGDIVGRAWFAVPGLGRVVAFVHQPVILGALAAAVVVFLVLVGPPLQVRSRRPAGESPVASPAEPPASG